MTRPPPTSTLSPYPPPSGSRTWKARLPELGGVPRELAPKPLGIRTAVRTGDTTMKERREVAKRPPHVLVTTPESMFILLTSESGRKGLSGVRTVIVDEIHAVVPDKRGAHLALSIERLQQLGAAPAL